MRKTSAETARKMDIKIRPNGVIEYLVLDGIAIPFREDDHGGFSIYITKNKETNRVHLQKENDDYQGSLYGIAYQLKYILKNNYLEVIIKVENMTDALLEFEKISIKIGIDTYMESYPQWNEIYFPTMLRCEKTHFLGYLQNPMGHCITLCSENPIASASCDYNRCILENGENYVGHRIYTVNLDLLNNERLGARFPNEKAELNPREIRTWSLILKTAKNETQAYKNAIEITKAPYIQVSKYTYEEGETIQITCDVPYTVRNEAGEVCVGKKLPRGYYTIGATKDLKETEISIYIRPPISDYLNLARKAAVTYVQKATTHTESWYGLFSGYLARKYEADKQLDNEIEAKFEEIYQLLYQETNVPTEPSLPWRIQNSGAMLSLLADIYEVTKEEKYLERGKAIADYIIQYSQQEDGAYYSNNTHYTCVIYPAKSMMEFAQVEEMAGGKWLIEGKKHFNSAEKAIANLYDLRDNIQTEGEQTFEDGMISCASLQLGMYALLCKNKEKRNAYQNAAIDMLKKHKCLEQQMIQDARMRGCTLRFWEGMYDVMITENMFNSPHGWTGWKIYATYYLYLLTGEKQYLIDTFDTLGACMQLLKLDGTLSWAFIADSNIKAGIWEQREVNQIYKEDETVYGYLNYQLISEQYIPMISDWYRSRTDKIVYGYPIVGVGRVNGMFQGGCCDNDVHEIFKVMEEVAMGKCFLHIEGNSMETYNCRIETLENIIEILPTDKYITTFIIYTDRECEVIIQNEKLMIYANKVTTIQSGIDLKTLRIYK